MTGPVHALERRWPSRGERAPFCADCDRRARYAYWVGVESIASYCKVHGEARFAAAVARGVQR